MIDATLQAMQAARAGAAGVGGVVGGTAWSLICFSPAYVSPALGDWALYGF